MNGKSILMTLADDLMKAKEFCRQEKCRKEFNVSPEAAET